MILISPSFEEQISVLSANVWSHRRRTGKLVNSGSWLRLECRCCSSGNFLTTELHLSIKRRASSASAGFSQWKRRLHLPSDWLGRTLKTLNPRLPQVLSIALTGSSYKWKKNLVCLPIHIIRRTSKFSFFFFLQGLPFLNIFNPKYHFFKSLEPWTVFSAKVAALVQWMAYRDFGH